jgi:hypothetical protein
MFTSSDSGNLSQRQIFEQYFAYRAAKEGAATPGQQQQVVRTLVAEARGDGRVPVGPNQSVKLAVADPAVQAVLKGETVSTGGQVIKPAGFSPANMSNAQKIAVLTGVALALIVLGLVVIALLTSGEPEAETSVTAAVTLAATAAPPTPAPPTPQPPTPEPPTPEPPTPTPVMISLVPDNAPPGANDPASIEIGGTSYTLSQGKVTDGVWTPQPGASEWLDQTYLRRVIALPFLDETVNAVGAMKAGDIVRVRLRSGEIVDYLTLTVTRVKQYQIETLSGREPSLVVFLHGEHSTDRWTVIAVTKEDAPEGGEPSIFSTYTPDTAATPGAVFGETNPAQVMNGMTASVAGLKITVSQCRRVSQISGAPPLQPGQTYAVCLVTAEAESANVTYNGSGMGIGEVAQMQAGVWPSPIPVAGSLGDGVLTQVGEAVTGQVAGIISTTNAQPALAWLYGGARYVLPLQIQ